MGKYKSIRKLADEQDAMIKHIERYLQNCFEALGVPLSEFNSVKDIKNNKGYKINEELEELIMHDTGISMNCQIKK